MNSRNAKAVLLLSVVVPLGLLVGFKFGGLFGEGAGVSETTYLPAVVWELERPGGALDLDLAYKAEKVYVSDEISVRLNATPFDYWENGRWGTDDTLSQKISANISLTRGFLRDLNIVFTESAHLAAVRYQPTGGDSGTRLTGLEIDSYASDADRRGLLRNGIKAFINMSGLNRPSGAFFEDFSDWYLLGSQNQTHEMQIVFEMTYFNGTLYKRLVQPFSFRLSRDSNDSFETAQEITTGYVYERLYIGNYDKSDYYTMYAGQGQRITAHAWATPSSPDAGYVHFYVLIYDPHGNCHGCSPFNYDVTFDVTTDCAGLWYVEVRAYCSYGFYSIRVDLQ